MCRGFGVVSYYPVQVYIGNITFRILLCFSDVTELNPKAAFCFISTFVESLSNLGRGNDIRLKGRRKLDENIWVLPKWVSPVVVADAIGKSTQTVRDMCRAGRLRCRRTMGRHRRINTAHALQMGVIRLKEAVAAWKEFLYRRAMGFFRRGIQIWCSCLLSIKEWLMHSKLSCGGTMCYFLEQLEQRKRIRVKEWRAEDKITPGLVRYKRVQNVIHSLDKFAADEKVDPHLLVDMLLNRIVPKKGKQLDLTHIHFVWEKMEEGDLFDHRDDLKLFEPSDKRKMELLADAWNTAESLEELREWYKEFNRDILHNSKSEGNMFKVETLDIEGTGWEPLLYFTMEVKRNGRKRGLYGPARQIVTTVLKAQYARMHDFVGAIRIKHCITDAGWERTELFVSGVSAGKQLPKDARSFAYRGNRESMLIGQYIVNTEDWLYPPPRTHYEAERTAMNAQSKTGDETFDRWTGS